MFPVRRELIPCMLFIRNPASEGSIAQYTPECVSLFRRFWIVVRYMANTVIWNKATLCLLKHNLIQNLL
jgi:hypothetical protein